MKEYILKFDNGCFSLDHENKEEASNNVFSFMILTRSNWRSWIIVVTEEGKIVQGVVKFFYELSTLKQNGCRITGPNKDAEWRVTWQKPRK